MSLSERPWSHQEQQVLERRHFGIDPFLIQAVRELETGQARARDVERDPVGSKSRNPGLPLLAPEAGQVRDMSRRFAKGISPLDRLAPQLFPVLDHLPHAELDGGQDWIRERRADEPELVHVLVNRLDESSILDEEQAALRERARHFVRRLRDAVGAEVFRTIRQRPAEMKVRCVRGVDDDRNTTFVRQPDDLREFPDDPEVVWRRQEHAVDVFTIEALP